ncbi:phosphotransferase system HPr (HPr) family protein [Anaerosolibacter carboniphilus]|uniref:Phosphocarrier protein HPr n=1 Tax=Anaerosolibacter carboniphilus TaxID=1417629 RepID=A0A841KUK2_9FIRM|nr:HPr family phosphocarrier protein [Anaerosolibacter carboniphilus]MBB6217316.1 phosphotransferase system HPr (HPr) family protein [Anaerosolibacter carboniphilus]
MTSQSATIMNETGMHARPASLFLSTATKFKSEVTIFKNGKAANAKSLISILSLCITVGTEIQISAEGEDEREAVETLVKLVESKFGEAL